MFSLGVVLYELLTDKKPFRGRHLDEIRDAVLRPRAAAGHKVDPTVPKTLAAIAARAMAKNPDHRYRSARAFARELRHWLDENTAGREGDGAPAAPAARHRACRGSPAAPGAGAGGGVGSARATARLIERGAASVAAPARRTADHRCRRDAGGDVASDTASQSRARAAANEPVAAAADAGRDRGASISRHAAAGAPSMAAMRARGGGHELPAARPSTFASLTAAARATTAAPHAVAKPRHAVPAADAPGTAKERRPAKAREPARERGAVAAAAGCGGTDRPGADRRQPVGPGRGRRRARPAPRRR